MSYYCKLPIGNYFHEDNRCDHHCEYCQRFNKCHNFCIPPELMPPTNCCECCLAGLRTVLGYLFSKGATDIRIQTIDQSPATINATISAFYPTLNDPSTALLVEIKNSMGTSIISICNIEKIQSTALIDPSTGLIPAELKDALAKIIIPSSCNNSCSEQLRLLFSGKVGQSVKSISTHANNVIPASVNNIVVGTGQGVVIVNLPGNDGAAINLCFVSSVGF